MEGRKICIVKRNFQFFSFLFLQMHSILLGQMGQQANKVSSSQQGQQIIQNQFVPQASQSSKSMERRIAVFRFCAPVSHVPVSTGVV